MGSCEWFEHDGKSEGENSKCDRLSLQQISGGVHYTGKLLAKLSSFIIVFQRLNVTVCEFININENQINCHIICKIILKNKVLYTGGLRHVIGIGSHVSSGQKHN